MGLIYEQCYHWLHGVISLSISDADPNELCETVINNKCKFLLQFVDGSSM